MNKQKINLRPRKSTIARQEAEKQNIAKWKQFEEQTFQQLMWCLRRPMKKWYLTEYSKFPRISPKVLKAKKHHYRILKLSDLYAKFVEDHQQLFRRFQYSKYPLMNYLITLRGLRGENLTLETLYFTVKYPDKSVYLFTYARRSKERCDVIKIPKTLVCRKWLIKKISQALQQTLCPKSWDFYYDMGVSDENILKLIGRKIKLNANIVPSEEQELYGETGCIREILKHYEDYTSDSDDESDEESGDQ